MPHYKDGTEAKVGDLVKGIGYNIKDDKGEKAVLVGKIVQITPGSDSCNLVLLTAETKKLDKDDPSFPYQVKEANLLFNTYEGGVVVAGNPSAAEMHAHTLRHEYGAISDFELVHRPE